MILRRLSAILFLFFASAWSHAAPVSLATYYNYLPWHGKNETSHGLNEELAKHLTELSGGKYEFIAEYIPRKRIDMLVSHGQEPIVVPWIAPSFFGDTEMTRYLWTPPLVEDESLIISSKNAPVEYTGLDSLTGKRFSASFGHQYADIDPLVAAGKIKRYDAPSLREATLKIVYHRKVDFGVIDRTTLVSMKSDRFLNVDLLHVAKTPRIPRYMRRLLIPKTHPELADFLQKAVEQLNKDPKWRAVLRKAGVFCPHAGTSSVLMECKD